MMALAPTTHPIHPAALETASDDILATAFDDDSRHATAFDDDSRHGEAHGPELGILHPAVIVSDGVEARSGFLSGFDMVANGGEDVTLDRVRRMVDFPISWRDRCRLRTRPYTALATSNK